MMHLSETPKRCEELDLMKALRAYGDGSANWRGSGSLGETDKAECRRLHSALASVITMVLGPMLDRVNAREMRTFTMHDSAHGLKVSHLMWNIIEPSRRKTLTPPEIALLVLSAHLHDLGMGLLNDEERQQRLSASSDLWHKVDVLNGYKRTLDDLQRKVDEGIIPSGPIALAIAQIAEAQDALLCIDCRERHATPERYSEILMSFRQAHLGNPVGIPSIDDALRFGDDSFDSSLISICVSHNEDAATLMEGKSGSKNEPRYPQAYPIGTSQANLHFVAAALRLADILDFDRERVPPVLYHYLLPRSGNPAENISVREWQKHMSISNWSFSKERVIFHGRSSNAIAHHAVVEFCKVIEEEIRRTLAVFGNTSWPFDLANRVDCDIHSQGFTYLPYRFELSQERIFGLLMGRSLYTDAKDAIRELVQNAVDACQLRDALLRVHRPSVSPALTDRIVITLQDGDSNDGVAKLTIQDSGTGMDRWIIENYFLKVGDSYYRSSDFLRTNAILWERSVGFTPVSEFGIGFLACFMLSSHIEVETAMPTSVRGDMVRRHLDIDGLGRLISVTEFPNIGYSSTEGTRIVLHLDTHDARSLDWQSLLAYVQNTCVELPYAIALRHIGADHELLDEAQVSSKGLSPAIPPELESSVVRIQVGSPTEIVEGEIVLFPYREITGYQREVIREQIFSIADSDAERLTFSNVPRPVLSRGGFSIGTVPGLPDYIGFRTASTALLRINAKQRAGGQFLKTDIARSRLVDGADEIEQFVIRSWLEPMISDGAVIKKLSPEPLSGSRTLLSATWLEKYSAYEIYSAARALSLILNGKSREELISQWERGEVGLLGLGLFREYVHRMLFEIVLPAVCRLHVGHQAALYIGTPNLGWADSLKENRTFVTAPVRWSGFARYIDPIDDLLFYSYPGCDWMSDRYEAHFRDFTPNDLDSLRRVFEKLVSSKVHGYLASLTSHEAKLLGLAARAAPDGRLGGTSMPGAPLSSFVK